MTLAAARRPAAPAAAGPKLERLADDTLAPWSYLQEYMWAAKQRCPNPGWNVLLSLGLRGPLDVAAVRDAIAFLVRRHEVLRTRLDETGQQVDEAAPIELPVTALSAADPRDELAEIARAQHRICLDLRHGPAVVPRLVRVAADEHVLLLTMDHASCDGWSAGIVLREFAAAYDALTAGRRPPAAAAARALPGLRGVPAQAGRGRRVRARSSATGSASSPDGPPNRCCRVAGTPRRRLATAAACASSTSNRGWPTRCVTWPPSDGSTVFAVLLGVLMASIAEVSGRTDIVVATLSAGRHHPDLAGVVGMFANPLLLRADVAAAATHRDLFDIVRTALASAHDHGTVPFPVVAQRARPGADRPEVWFNMAPPIMFPQARNVASSQSELPRNYVIEVPAAGWRGENLLVNGHRHRHFDPTGVRLQHRAGAGRDDRPAVRQLPGPAARGHHLTGEPGRRVARGGDGAQRAGPPGPFGPRHGQGRVQGVGVGEQDRLGGRLPRAAAAAHGRRPGWRARAPLRSD